jgi:predicted Zn-dependent protease
MKNAQAAALLAGLVGMGGAVAAGLSGAPDLSRAGVATAMGGMQVAQRSLLAYQRQQESSADRAAIDFLEKTGQSPSGLLATLKRLANDTLLSSRTVDPYTQNHPLPSERVIALQSLVDKSPFRDRKDPPDLQRRHDLVRAKLVGFTWAPDRVARRFPLSDTSLPARYARAIVTYRRGALAPAMEAIDGLIKADPNDPYFWELKGQALFEGGKASAAIAPLNQAVALAPQAGLIKVLLGQALVDAGGGANIDEAIKQLTIGLQADPDVPTGYRALGRAYAMKNDIPMAELATAQGLFAEGNYSEAKLHATRAQVKLKLGTPAWLRADDIISYKPPKLH